MPPLAMANTWRIKKNQDSTVREEITTENIQIVEMLGNENVSFSPGR